MMIKNDEERVLKYHDGNFPGKIRLALRKNLNSSEDLSLAYTPHVAEVSRLIARDEDKIDNYTSRWNSLGIITNGTRVLGLGNIGAKAALPVMEGKSMIYKKMANIDAFPLCVEEDYWRKIVQLIGQLHPSFKLFHLEDIRKPDCFYIQDELERKNILSFHDDRHGTASAVVGGLMNALKIQNKKIKDVKIVVNGAGAAGIGISEALLRLTKNIVLVDSKGIVSRERKDLDEHKKEVAKKANINDKGTLEDALKDADVFIGVSKSNILKERHLKIMNYPSVIFALANPVPEINPKIAEKYGIVGTGRSDYKNQINNSVSFPGMARGLLDSCASKLTEDIIIAAAEGISSSVDPSKDKIVPSTLDKNNVKNVAISIFKLCKNKKASRTKLSIGKYKKRLGEILEEK